MNKLIKISIIILCLVLIGSGVYFFFLRTSTRSPQTNISNPEFPSNSNISEGIPPQQPNQEAQTETFEDQEYLLTEADYFKITTIPIKGYTLSTEETEFGFTVSYQDASTGHIYNSPFLKGYVPDKLSNTTIPRIYKSIITPNNQKIILQYFAQSQDHFETFLGTIIRNTSTAIIDGTNNENQTPYRIEGEFLPQNIREVVLSPDNSQLFYLRVFEDRSEGVVMNIDGSQSKTIFTSLLKEWVADWSSSNIILTTKPSGEVKGFSYQLQPSTGALTELIKNTEGLTLLPQPKTGELILFSRTSPTAGSIILKLFNKNNTQTSSLTIHTLPEKCTWSIMQPYILYCAIPKIIPQAIYPDDWYKGEVSFSDEFVYINTQTGQITPLIDPVSFEEDEVDAINLKLSNDEDYLLFINKKDSSLWSIKL